MDMHCSAEIDKIAEALSKMQASLKFAVKDSVNPHFKNSYADLASVWVACRSELAANGLSVVQLPSATGTVVTLTTVLLHTSGQFFKSSLSMTAQQNTPQSIGSAITYARRYALSAMVGIAQDDDDGQAASVPPPPPRPKAEPKVQRQQPKPPVFQNGDAPKPTDRYQGSGIQKLALSQILRNNGIADRDRQIQLHEYLISNPTEMQHIEATLKALFPTGYEHMTDAEPSEP